MKEKIKIYRIRKKYVKNEEKILEKGFSIFENKENQEEKVLAMPVHLKEDSFIVQKILKVINSKAFKEEMKEEIKESDFVYDEEGKLILNDKIRADLCNCQLAINLFGPQQNVLYINAPNGSIYYEANLIKLHLPEIIDVLYKERIIFEDRVKEDFLLQWEKV